MWVLRHGQTQWNVDGRMQGHLDSPLTPLGEAQARAQGALLKALHLPENTKLISSPSGRAVATAHLVNEGLDLPMSLNNALMEIDMGHWQGKTLKDIASVRTDLPHAEDPHLWKFHAPGGERLTEMHDRLSVFLRGLNSPSVLVTHGVTSRVLRCIVLNRQAETLSDLPGGQGVVHQISESRAQVLAG